MAAAVLRFSALALIVVGCVSVPSSPSPTDAHGRTTTTISEVTTTTVSVSSGLDAYRMCLAGEGLVIPEIPLDGRGRPRLAIAMTAANLGDSDVLDALNICAGELSGGPLDLSSDDVLAEMVTERLAEYSFCMRTHGVESFPDPVRGYHGVGSPFNVRRIDWSDPAIPAAAEACSARIGLSAD